VPPKRYRGMKAMSASLSLGKFGTVTVDLHVLPWDMSDATVSLYGRGGVRICLLSDLEDFRALPWTDRRLEGYIRCDNLKRTADKTAVVPDQVYQVFVKELYRIEPEIREMIDRISASSLERRFEIVLGKTSRLVDRFIRYRERGLLDDLSYRPRKKMKRAAPASVKIEKAMPPLKPVAVHREPDGGHSLNIRLFSPPEERSQSRSWLDRDTGCICVNREHQEFLLSQREDSRCIRYLFTIWVKESLLEEYGSDAERLADEMVGRLSEAEPLLW
jgi:hypothetical protein